jgi:hypothetical protein
MSARLSLVPDGQKIAHGCIGQSTFNGGNQMGEEIKKPEQVTTEPSGEPLPEKELDKVVGGESVSLNFSKIELSYIPQNAEGTAGK